jgi:hypothetical protein
MEEYLFEYHVYEIFTYRVFRNMYAHLIIYNKHHHFPILCITICSTSGADWTVITRAKKHLNPMASKDRGSD